MAFTAAAPPMYSPMSGAASRLWVKGSVEGVNTADVVIDTSRVRSQNCRPAKAPHLAPRTCCRDGGAHDDEAPLREHLVRSDDTQLPEHELNDRHLEGQPCERQESVTVCAEGKAPSPTHRAAKGRDSTSCSVGACHRWRA